MKWFAETVWFFQGFFFPRNKMFTTEQSLKIIHALKQMIDLSILVSFFGGDFAHVQCDELQSHSRQFMLHVQTSIFHNRF